MDIILASGNKHKKEEFSHMFPRHRIILPADIGIEFEIEETGRSFFENALLKAEYVFAQTDKPVLADDSGLCVDALGGSPGIFTARYGDPFLGPDPSAEDRYMHLLHNLHGADDRSARFICSLVYYSGRDKFFCVQETVEGSISFQPSGRDGFGYDPVFYVPEYQCTMAELSPEVKHSISHRGKAAKTMRSCLETL